MSIGNNVAQTVPILQTLINDELLTNDQARLVEFDSVNNSKSVEDVLLSSDAVPLKAKIRAKSIIFNIPFVDILNTTIKPDVISQISQDIAKKYMAVAFEEDNKINNLKVAMVDPTNMENLRILSTLSGKIIQPFFANPDDLKHVIETRYGAQVGVEVKQALQDVGNVVDISENDQMMSNLEGDISSAPVTKIVNAALNYAAKSKASDIHIEPRENKLSFRFRINGVLYEKINLPIKLMPAIISRIKILCNAKIDEHRVPQDGRFQIKVEQEVIDLRVSIIPTIYGESIVIRLLEKGGGEMTLEQTGLTGRNLDEFYKTLHKTQGMLLVTGPTGSGKTITLASCLKILNTESVNIITLEDPVEIRVDGVNQVQVNSEVGLTFSKGLRSFLRQDPNIIMLGEIRDSETAELAVQAALTGHLVLSTLHTNDAATAIPRLVDMNIEPFLISSTLDLLAAQRLARTICKNCKYSYEANDEEKNKMRDVLKSIKGFNFDEFLTKNNGKMMLFKGKGCAQCGETGYNGRIGIFEVITVSDGLRELIIKREGAQKIEQLAMEEGMTQMVQDGFIKVLQGITTMEEILRVVN